MDAVFYNGVSARPIDAQVSLSDENQQLLIEVDGETPILIAFSDIAITHSENGLIVLSFGKNPNRVIEVRDESFRSHYLKINHSGKKGITYFKLLNAGWKVHVLLALLIIGFCFGTYFYFIPYIAESAVSLLPRSFDKKVGDMAFEQSITGEEIDSAATLTMNEYLKKMMPDEYKNYHLNVVKSDELNAFALPNGEIVIYSKMLRHIKTDDELSGLLSHEISHVTNRHSMRLLCKSLSGYLLLSVMMNDVNGLMTIILDNAHNLQQLSFSRTYEEEADISGLKLLEQYKINPKGMIDLFEILQKEHSVNIPGFLSTHPVTSDRITYIKKHIKNHPFSFTPHPELMQLLTKAKTQMSN
jgi:predicted Zn-dependent protease